MKIGGAKKRSCGGEALVSSHEMCIYYRTTLKVTSKLLLLSSMNRPVVNRCSLDIHFDIRQPLKECLYSLAHTDMLLRSGGLCILRKYLVGL